MSGTLEAHSIRNWLSVSKILEYRLHRVTNFISGRPPVGGFPSLRGLFRSFIHTKWSFASVARKSCGAAKRSIVIIALYYKPQNVFIDRLCFVKNEEHEVTILRWFLHLFLFVICWHVLITNKTWVLNKNVGTFKRSEVSGITLPLIIL